MARWCANERESSSSITTTSKQQQQQCRKKENKQPLVFFSIFQITTKPLTRAMAEAAAKARVRARVRALNGAAHMKRYRAEGGSSSDIKPTATSDLRRTILFRRNLLTMFYGKFLNF